MTLATEAAAGDAGESKSPRYRLVLADDRDDILEELRHLLAPCFDVVGTVKDGAALIDAVTGLKPDAVVCDIFMPRLNGIDSALQILRLGLCKAVVMLTMHNEPNLVGKVLEEGIQGYVLKEDASDELMPAVYAALDGRTYLSRGVVNGGRFA